MHQPNLEAETKKIKFWVRYLEDELLLQVKCTAIMGKLRAMLAQRTGVRVSEIELVTSVGNILIVDHDTPNSLGLVQGDIIEMYELEENSEHHILT